MAMRNCGAGWIKETKDKESFISASIEVGGKRINVVLFKNPNKRTDKDPDFTAWRVWGKK